jgi:hypothetical protein
MNNSKWIIRLCVFSFVIIFAIACSSTKEGTTTSTTNTEIVTAIAADNWQFTPQQMLPQRGRSLQVTSDYFLKVSKDKIQCYLPYAGRSFSGMDVMNNQSPTDFTSTNFEFTKTERKKGGFDILIKPKDVRAIQSLQATVFETGNASIQVILTDRTPISYNGIIGVTKN